MSSLTFNTLIDKLQRIRAKGIETIGVKTSPDALDIEEVISFLIRAMLNNLPEESVQFEVTETPPAKITVSEGAPGDVPIVVHRSSAEGPETSVSTVGTDNNPE